MTSTAVIPATAPPTVRVESLTGLRWFAAFAVFIFHANQGLIVPKVGPLLAFGDAGVTFFYVLSGFVLTWSFRPHVSTSVFYWRRWARIWPILAVTTVFAWIMFRQSGTDSVWQTVLSLTLVESWFRPVGSGMLANPVAWSVSCEAFFYLVFPFLIRPMLRLRLRWLAGTAVALLLIEWGYWIAAQRLIDPTDFWVQYSWFLRLPLFRLPEFLLGVIAAAAMLRGWRPRWNLWLALSLIPATVLVLWYGARQGLWPPHWSQHGLAPACAVVVVAAAMRDLRQLPSFLRSRLMVTLGSLSYAFYLIHLSVLSPMAGLVDRDAPLSHHVAVALTAAALATALAWIAYRYFELPVERWLRARYPRVDVDSAARSVPAQRRPVEEQADPLVDDVEKIPQTDLARRAT